MLGLFAAISTAIALVTIFAIGKLIDKEKGRALLNFGAISNGLLHLVRPFVSLPAQALAVNIANEPLTAMYRMPFLKGRYDASDSVPGYRITYFMLIEFFISWANIIFWAILAGLATYVGDKPALQVSFIIGALMSFIITQQRFAALHK
jgi:hypothetical protein